MQEGAEIMPEKAMKALDLILYGTSACHLCEVAEALLQQQQKTHTFNYIKCDVSESDELFTQYGVRIPVLRRDDGAELGWPFNTPELDAFLANAGV